MNKCEKKQNCKKEIEEERKKLAKEQTHYMNALEKLNQQISNADETTLAELEEKKRRSFSLSLMKLITL